MKYLLLLLPVLVYSCRTTDTYYVVRHAEKEATASGDVPLSATGKERAEALKEKLKNKKVTAIYTTPYVRTTATVMPLSKALQMPVQNYKPGDTTFFAVLKKIEKGNVLIAGHSNTVDDLANALAGEKVVEGDLPESAYGDLFIITKKGKKTTFKKEHFGN